MFRGRQVKTGYVARKNSEAFSIVGGVAAILFPVMSYYLAYVQLMQADQYEDALL